MTDSSTRAARRFPDIQGQRGLATTEQLRAAGWTADAIRHAKQRTWRMVMPGVLMPHRGPLTFEDLVHAAHLWAGPYAVLTGTVALRLAGLSVRSKHLGPVFLVPATSRKRAAQGAVTVRTTRDTIVAAHRIGLPLASVSRALCDAARYQGLPADELTALTIEALQRGHITPGELEAEIRFKPQRDLHAIERGLSAFRKGAWSLPEHHLSRLMDKDPSLPEMLLNPTLTTVEGVHIGTPDGYIAEAGVALQVHSQQYHRGYDQRGADLWAKTVEGDSAYVAHGVVVLGITPSGIERRPQQVLRRVRDVVALHLGRDVSHIVVTPRDSSEPRYRPA